jgi:hypothetical protein
MKLIIKTNLIETMFVCCLATLICPFLLICFICPFTGFTNTTPFLISIFFILFIFLDVLIIKLNTKNNNNLLLFDSKIVLENSKKKIEIPLQNIENFIYFKCKWYFIPFLPLYKNGKAGLLEIYTLNRKYCCRIFYKDYKQLKRATATT